MISTNLINNVSNADDNEGWIDSTVRTQRPTPRQTPSRHCSYCRSPNHTIQFCNHESLNIFETDLYAKKVFIKSVYIRETIIRKINYFESTLFYVPPLSATLKKLVRAFATSKCGSSANKLYYDHVKAISKYIWYNELEAERITRINEQIAIRNMLNMNNSLINEEIIGINGDVLGWIDRNPERLPPITPDFFHFYTNQIKRYDIQKIELCKEISHEKNKECSICYEDKEQVNFVKLNCEHEFCGICVKTIIDKNNNPSCAFCRKKIEKLEIYNDENEILLVNNKK